MQTGARYQAVLDLLSEIFQDKRPADNIINEYMRSHKFIGSKDRRFISEEVWNIIRNRHKLEFDTNSTDARKILLWHNKAHIHALFDGSQYGISSLTEAEKKWLSTENTNPYPDYIEAECPQWIFAQNPNIEFFKSLNQPACADFRVHNSTTTDIIQQLKAEGIEASPTPYSPYGIRIKERININNCIAFQEGKLEVQDEASQIAAILCDAHPQHKIIDYCCGAGGKSLALSHILNNQGTILAHDINAKRLDAIKPRIARLNVKNIELTDIIADSDKDFDRFIIDAPCSGTGTWRRSPDAKFRLNTTQIKHLNTTQKNLLELAATKTKTNGRIIYITCSILDAENEHIINHFLSVHPEFSLADISQIWKKHISTPYPSSNKFMLRMSPYHTNTDGFFVSVLQKKS